MAGYKVEICGVNTAALPLLKTEEKELLLKKIKNGDTQARERFINGNLRLVLSIVQRFSQSSENIDDLFQIGCVGMIKAIDNFDISQGVQFSTYAVPMIIGEIKRYLRDSNPIRTRQHQKEPTVTEIADEIGVSKEDIVLAMEAIQSPVSLYEPVYSEGGDTLYIMDQVSDKKNKEENWVQHIALHEAMEHLDTRERRIINMRFFECKTQMETAEEIGISQAQVSRLEKNALKSMKKYLS